MDFTIETNKAIEKVIAEKLPILIEERASKMIESIVSDIFSWGDVKNSIKKKIEESINVNLQEFDLIDYNALIAKTINENLVKQINLQPILDMTQSIIGFVNKKEVSLQEIADLFIQASREDSIDYEGEITFIVEENTTHNWIEVYGDIKPNQNQNKCAINFIFSDDDDRKGKIFSFKTKDRYFESEFKNISPSRLIALGNLEAEIFRIYSAQVVITDFTDEINNYWYRHD